MAIKERKQITGTEAQIKGYAGHNGILVYATDTKHLHVLSGTAGTTTELANRTDIPDITGKADTTYVNAELDKKQPKGDYATNTALTSGLAGKANSSHTHTVSQITDMPKVVLSVNAITPTSVGDVNLGLHAVATSGDYNDLRNKPSLPPNPAAYITNTWNSPDGTSWYRRWSDGRLEQGGRIGLEVWTGGPNPFRTFSLPAAFSNATYTTVVTGEGGYGWTTLKAVSQTTSSVEVTGTGASTDDYVSYVHFYCSGY